MSYEDLQQMDAHIKAKEKIYKQRPLKPKQIASRLNIKYTFKKSKTIRNPKLPAIKRKLWGAE